MALWAISSKASEVLERGPAVPLHCRRHPGKQLLEHVRADRVIEHRRGADLHRAASQEEIVQRVLERRDAATFDDVFDLVFPVRGVRFEPAQQTRPVRTSVSMAVLAWPTPGKIKRSARATRSGSDVNSAAMPTASQARFTLRKLPPL